MVHIDYTGSALVNCVYILKCKDDSLYTGWTNNIEARVKAHNEDRGAKYTRGRGPVELVYLEEVESRSDAMKREHAIKLLSHAEKIALIESQETL